MKKRSILFIMSISIIILLTGCQLKGENGKVSFLEVELKNLEPLNQGYYELWVISGLQRQKVKRFNMKEGKLIDLETGKKIKKIKVLGELQESDLVQITINTDEKKTKGESLLLSGAIENGQANLSFQTIQLNDIAGTYIIGSLSDKNSENEKNGIWFLNLENGNETKSLKIQPTPYGWIYEGWLEYKGVLLSIGRFGSRTGRDTNGIYSPTVDIPNYPGEDFIKNEPYNLLGEFPLDLTTGDKKVFITLEPDLDGFDPTGEKPFFITIFSSEIPANAQIHTQLPLEPHLETLPTGIAKIIEG